MKNREEFKNSIYRKLDQYYINKHNKRMRFTKTLAPVCVCAFLVLIVVLHPLRDILKTKEDLSVDVSPKDEKEPEISTVLSSVLIVSNMGQEDEHSNLREFLDQDKMNTIVRYIDSFKYSDATDNIDDSVPNFNITITYSNGKNVIYYFKGNLVKEGSKNWRYISESQLTSFLDLINSMETNK